MSIDYALKNLLKLLLAYMEIYFKKEGIIRIASVYKSEILWKNLIKDESSECRLNNTALLFAIYCLSYSHFYP